jgi:hypothetical protein
MEIPGSSPGTKDTMRTILTSLLFLSSVAVAHSQDAHTPQASWIYGLNDIDGNRLAYSFAPNTQASGPNKIGSLIETGYSRNSVAPPYKDNRYPFWTFQLIDNGITILTPRDTPEWKMIFSISTAANKFPVVLFHGSSLRASGDCVQFQQGTPS